MQLRETETKLIVGRYASFPLNTPIELQEAITNCIRKRVLVRVWYGDTKTGRVNFKDNPVIEGLIKREPNLKGLPVIIPKGEFLGPNLDVLNVLRICTLVRKIVPEELAHEHKTSTFLVAEPIYSVNSFDPGEWEIIKRGANTFQVFWNGRQMCVYGSELKARKHISAMRGELYYSPSSIM